MNCRKLQPCVDSHFRTRIIPCGHEMASASFLIPVGPYFGNALMVALLKNWRNQRKQSREVTLQVRFRRTVRRCSCGLPLMLAMFGACLWMGTTKQNH